MPVQILIRMEPVMSIPTHIVLQIRYATSADNTLLANIGAQTFYDSYIAQTRPAAMLSYLATTFSPEDQALELAEPTSRFLVVEIDGAPAGYAKLQFVPKSSTGADQKLMEIERLYVCKEWIGQGVGSQLMSACLGEAEREACNVVRLAVWEENLRAIDFYRKWGFTEAGKQIFHLGDEVQRDLTMIRSM
jgi:diamine N-acetyltransferase